MDRWSRVVRPFEIILKRIVINHYYHDGHQFHCQNHTFVYDLKHVDMNIHAHVRYCLAAGLLT